MLPSTSPRALRVLLLLAVALGLMVSLSATQDAVVVMSIDSVTPNDSALAPVKAWIQLSAEQELALKAQQRATWSALQAMATPRTIVLGLLAAVSLMVFSSAVRIRWAAGEAPVGLAQRLGLSALAAAIFRTLDGAQQLVVVQRATEAHGRSLAAAGSADAEAVLTVTRAGVSILSVAWTILIVGLFVLIGTYFRSPKVLATFAQQPDDE